MISLYIHTSHDGCVTCIKNKRLLFHHQIDRFNKFKHTTSPHISFFKELTKLNEKIDRVFFTFFIRDHATYIWEKYLKRLRIIDKSTEVIYCTDKHHIFHASCAKLFYPNADYYFVWDREGFTNEQNETEQESLFNSKLTKVYSNVRKADGSNIGFGRRYDIATKICGFDSFEEGKTMALAQYKKPGAAFFEQRRLENKSLILFKTLELLHFKKGDTICLTGGVTQNVVNNSNLRDKLKDLNIVADPFNGDFGISLGAAAYYEDLHRVYIPLKSIYTGLSTEIDINRFYKYYKKKVEYKEVCEILQEEPVAIFQSKSEQGQRGLGNRSLLLDINAKDAINKINAIKKREWFRPFACSIYEHDASTWFDTKGKLSPYMMFTFKSKKPKLTKNVCCVNNTSRIQTVNQYSNYGLTCLLRTNKRFYGRPLLLNTSLNLPGHTLVETVDDLLYMFENTPLNYIYFPEIHTLVSKNDIQSKSKRTQKNKK
jgi:predicted NodU family carbamoyl transferase